mgnify:CR=1 FL=1
MSLSDGGAAGREDTLRDTGDEAHILSAGGLAIDQDEVSLEVDHDEVSGGLAELCADDARLRGSPRARFLLLTALLKQLPQKPEAVAPLLRPLAERFKASSRLELQQRALEALDS